MKKIIKYLAFAGITGAVVYWISGVKCSTASHPNSAESLGSSRANHPKQAKPERSPSEKGISENDGSTLNRKDEHSDYSDHRTQKMYKDLGMTEDQKRRYERDYRSVMGTWEKNNPNYDMDEQGKIDEHNAVLKAVLDEAQYSMYRDWFRNNPAD